MTKTQRSAAATAEDSFHRHYAAIWGDERWHDSLYPALLRSTRYASMNNRYVDLAIPHKTLSDACGQLDALNLHRVILPADPNEDKPESLAPNCWVVKQTETDGGGLSTNVPQSFPPPSAIRRSDGNHLLSHWNLDAASLLVASMLDVQPGDQVLDLCAAPGGKSIALAQRLWPYLHENDSAYRREFTNKTSGVLHSNEPDQSRHRRLTENLKQYLPPVLFENVTDARGRLSKRATTLKIDASKPGAADDFPLSASIPSQHGYDKVLVDAPCSSERHIIHAQAKARAAGRTASELASWRPESSKRLAKTQVDVLMTGLRTARLGGTVVYATCSIESVENDGVVEKVLAQVEKERKKGAKWKVNFGYSESARNEALEDPVTGLVKNWAEKTKFGWIVLPDHPSGGMWGPLFFTILTKVKE